MGLFSSDESETDVPNKRVKELVDKAQSDTVTKERLTKADTSGIVARGINMGDDPLIEYLDEDEQPHFIFFSTNSIPPFKIPETEAELSTGMSSRSAVCITDRRFVVVVSGTGGGLVDVTELDEDELNKATGQSAEDVLLEMPFESVVDFETIPSEGGLKIDAHKINLRVSDSEIIEKVCLMFDEDYEEFGDTDEIDIVIANAFDKSDIEEVGDYLEKAIREVKLTEGSEEITTELSASFYHIDGISDEIPDTTGQSYFVTLDNSAIKLSGIAEHNSGNEDVYEIKYEEIAAINDFEGANDSNGIEIILSDDTNICLFRSKLSNEPQFPDEVRQMILEKSNCSETKTNAEYILLSKRHTSRGKLRVEGWQKGSAEISADIDAESQSTGKSRGVELGAFSRSKSSMKSSIEGNVSGKITDNTYTTGVDAFVFYADHLILDSEIKLNLNYLDIDNIFEQTDGVVIEVGSNTFRVNNIPAESPVGGAVRFVKDRMRELGDSDRNTSPEEDDTSNSGAADKLRELKELHNEGILTDEEFETKKEELLDDF